MDNKTKYKKVFSESFELNDSELAENLEYNGTEAWDSIGHMGMIASLEEEFDIMMETDDIIDFSSFKKGIEILQKYGVDFNN